MELLVAIVVGAVLMASLTGFYLSQQKATRHHQIEIETSQALRTALEQMSRDIRSARKDLTYNILTGTGGASPTFLTWSGTAVEFTLDWDDDGTITSSEPNERKGFRYDANAHILQALDATSNTYFTLAENIDISGSPCNGVMFAYKDASTPPVAATSANTIKRVDICITAKRSIIGGLPIVRTETASVQLRNVN